MKATETVGPVLIHIITEKGRGYTPAETASDKMHGVGKYDIVTGKQIKPSTKARGGPRTELMLVAYVREEGSRFF